MSKGPFITALIAAAGTGRRMKRDINKQFIPIQEKPVLMHALERFALISEINQIIILIRDGEQEAVEKIIKKVKFTQQVSITVGGQERQDSIAMGLRAMDEKTEIVLTHDGARPFVSLEEIQSIIRGAINYGACCLMTPMKDTVKISDDGSWSRVTPDRSKLFAIQTPQGFKRSILEQAYRQAYEENYYGTDDCSLVEKAGYRVRLIRGSYNNIKITTPEDLLIAEILGKEDL